MILIRKDKTNDQNKVTASGERKPESAMDHFNNSIVKEKNWGLPNINDKQTTPKLGIYNKGRIRLKLNGKTNQNGKLLEPIYI